MPTHPLAAGLQAAARYTVEPADTAVAVGSGDLQVLGTPRLLAWMEGATCQALSAHLLPDETSVGSRVSIEHQAASVVGAELEVQATLVHVDGRLVRFEVVALVDGQLVGRAEITRVIVDRARFLSRL
jgi:fluoroacetyl-CoA thioesterase